MVLLPEVFLADAEAELLDNAVRFSSPGVRICDHGAVLSGRSVIAVGVRERSAGVAPPWTALAFSANAVTQI
jgi:hypothetical protein